MAKRIVWTEQAKADVRSIEQPIALQILKTLARCAQNGEGNTKQLRDIEPPLIRLRAQDHRVFFRDKGDYLEISRVLDRKEACEIGIAGCFPAQQCLQVGEEPMPLTDACGDWYQQAVRPEIEPSAHGYHRIAAAN